MNIPMAILGDTANDLFVTACDIIFNYGEESSPRGMKIKEINNCTLTLTNPYDNIVNSKYRNISLRYLIAEWLWYVKGLQDKEGADFICKYAPFWNTIRNSDGSLNSNYGHYFFKRMIDVLPVDESVKNVTYDCYNISQFEYIVTTLLNDTDSRQAVVNINNIYHKANKTKDFPCTTAMQFFIRDNKLRMTVTMRSTDLVLGFCNDIFQFTMFQSVVLNEINKNCIKLNKQPIEMGVFTLFTSSLHVYERHFDMMKNVVNNENDTIFIKTIDWIKDLKYNDFLRILNEEDTIDADICHYRNEINSILN